MLRHLAAILALPTVAAIIIPAGLLLLTGTLNIGWGLPSPFNAIAVVVSLGLLGGGLLLAVTTIRLFITQGQGTLAPWDPTERLVVSGVYRHVRNPMISGMMSILLGEAVLFGSWPVLVWALLFITVNLIYIPLVEEPGLAARFGSDYRDYVRHVPRWLPRRTPWTSA